MSKTTTVGAFDAKTHLDELLRRVARGETIGITLRGTLVAKLVPAGDTIQENALDAVRKLRKLRKGFSLRGLKTKELIHEGRRY